MATPYFQQRHDTVSSTQNLARDALKDLPVLVLAQRQTEGRGRTGNNWENATRALAASMAMRVDENESRPLSLIAGVAAQRATQGTSLKWPNDVMIQENKVGGILVERSGGVAVVGFGLNLWWPESPPAMSALSASDPGGDLYAEIGALWGAELMRLIDSEGWPIDEYRSGCVTLGREIRWEPEGIGVAVDVADDGGLIVDRDGQTEVVYSGEISHLRHT